MSVVMVTNRRPSPRWEGYHGLEATPAWLLALVVEDQTSAPGSDGGHHVRGLRDGPRADAVAGGTGWWRRSWGDGGVGPGLPVVPLGAVGPISAVLGRDLPGYGVVGLTATNAEQDLRAEFSSTGVKVVSGRLRLGLALVGYGYAGSSGALPAWPR